MVELQQARDPSELAQCSLELEKAIKRRAQPKWWRHERPIWVQGLLALARSSQAIANCEPERLLQQLVLTLAKLVRTLDLSALAPAVDERRRQAEELSEVLGPDESGEVVHGDAPVCDFFLQRKRRRLQRGDALLPPVALRRLRQLARQPTAGLLAEVVALGGELEGSAGAGDVVAAWTRLLTAPLRISHGGIGTLGAASAGTRPSVVCAPDTMRLLLDEATGEMPSHLLRIVCQRALRTLAAAHGVALFEVPIEEAIASCPMPGYLARVKSKRLLDLPKIRARVGVAPGCYESLAEFRHDLRDMFQNAIDYHGPRGGRGAAAVAGSLWIAQCAAELHALVEGALPGLLHELWPREGTYQSPVDALPRPWALLELAHAARRVASEGFLRDVPAVAIGEMREACMHILEAVQKEVAERLMQCGGTAVLKPSPPNTRG
jgi:hypothetical protein